MLRRLHHARAALRVAEAHCVEEVKDIRDKPEAMALKMAVRRHAEQGRVILQLEHPAQGEQAAI